MKFKHILFSIATAGILASCTDVLDKKDLSAITEDDVWNNAQYATAYLNKLYRDNLPGWDLHIAGYSDEAYGEAGTLYGQLTTNSVDTWNYTSIRNINIMLSSLQAGSIDTETQASLKAQALVLRAWRYFQMVRQYGGIPMIMQPQATTDDLYVTRKKTSECIDLIIADLDEAIEHLPWQWTNDDEGRFTKATVMASKEESCSIMPAHSSIRKTRPTDGRQPTPTTSRRPNKLKPTDTDCMKAMRTSGLTR